MMSWKILSKWTTSLNLKISSHIWGTCAKPSSVWMISTRDYQTLAASYSLIRISEAALFELLGRYQSTNRCWMLFLSLISLLGQLWLLKNYTTSLRRCVRMINLSSLSKHILPYIWLCHGKCNSSIYATRKKRRELKTTSMPQFCQRQLYKRSMSFHAYFATWT